MDFKSNAFRAGSPHPGRECFGECFGCEAMRGRGRDDERQPERDGGGERERRSDRDESETLKGDGQRPARYTESRTKADTNER